MRTLATALLAAGLLAALPGLAACGGADEDRDPTAALPDAGGVRAGVREALRPAAGDFPAVGGRTLQQVSDGLDGTGPEAVLASSVFTTGRNRLAFGAIDGKTNAFVYGRTAVYLARTPEEPARGPFLAPADLLLTQPRYRSRQAASERDRFAAVYAAEVTFDRPGTYTALTVTDVGGRLIGSPLSVRVVDPEDDPVPDVGERAPRVQTDTEASARGDLASIDTRLPPSDMHERSFADVVGRKPVALLFATPQLCQSRVCGPVVDVALQLRRRYGDAIEFIHQEVYRDNDPAKGLRRPLARFDLPSEPWLFVVDASGRITARLEGSFGPTAFAAALETAR